MAYSAYSIIWICISAIICVALIKGAPIWVLLLLIIPLRLGVTQGHVYSEDELEEPDSVEHDNDDYND
jgi:hypothetical protein